MQQRLLFHLFRSLGWLHHQSQALQSRWLECTSAFPWLGVLTSRKGWKWWAGVVCLLWYAFFALPPSLFSDPLSVVLEDRNGELLGARIAPDGQWRFPDVDTLPAKFATALIAFEDKHFYKHWGVDPLSIGRAMLQNIQNRSIVSGGSTLTMQLIRLSRKGQSRNLWEKLIEAILATRLEIRSSKAAILQQYASNAPFGGNVVGISAASWRYYGKRPQLLSWGEAATLAVLPNAPALIHPGRNRDALYHKRNRLLDKLLERQLIDSLTCDLAKAEPLPDAPLPLPRHAPHLLERAKREQAATNAHIQSTIDKNLQIFTNNIAQKHHALLAANGIYNLSIMIMDVETGETLAYVGNISRPQSHYSYPYANNNASNNASNANATNNNTPEDHGQAVDVITAPRSSGSILKPFLYGLMIHEGQLLPTNTLPDIPTQMQNYRPKNYYETYDGTVPANQALARSLNVPMVRALQTYGLEKFHFHLKKMGLSTINRPPSYYGLPLVLGGAEVRLWDLMGIYASMARTLNHFYDYDGRYALQDWRMPHYLKHHTIINSLSANTHHTKNANNNANDASNASNNDAANANNNNANNDANNPNPKNAKRSQLLREAPYMSAAAIWATFEAMLKVERPTEDGAWELFESNRRIAWKTGTSFGFRDAWAIGVSPQYAVGVWVGNADGEGRPGLIGVQAAAPVLFDVFNYLGAEDWFGTPYDELRELTICQQSGYLATDLCHSRDTLLLPQAGANSKACPYHKLVHLDASGSWRVHADCAPPHEMQHLPWFVLPPVEEFYYKYNHPNYQPLPPYRADCLASLPNREAAMELIYPQNINKIYVPREMDGTLGKVIFKVAHRRADAVIYWHLDNTYIDATTTFHEIALQPTEGKHTLTLVDNAGNTLQQTFETL